MTSNEFCQSAGLTPYVLSADVGILPCVREHLRVGVDQDVGLLDEIGGPGRHRFLRLLRLLAGFDHRDRLGELRLEF
jgi:hypothetical protein